MTSISCVVLAAALLTVRCVGQTPDTSAVDGVARVGGPRRTVIDGRAMLLRSPTSVVDALRWSRGVTHGEQGRVGVRNIYLDPDQFVVDGLPYGDRFAPGLATNGGPFLPAPSLLSIDSIAIDHGPGARFALSGLGLVDIAMRRGRGDRITGGGRVRSDVAPLFGIAPERRVVLPNLFIDTLVPAANALAENSRLYELFVEGPIASLPLRFHLSASYNPIEYLGATYDVVDAPESFFEAHRENALRAAHVVLSPTSLGRLPHSSAMRWDIYGNVTAEPLPGLTIGLAHEAGLARRDVGSLSMLYMLDHPRFGGDTSSMLADPPPDRVDLSIVERDAQGISTNATVSRTHVTASYVLPYGARIGLDLAYDRTTDRMGKRDVAVDPGPFGGFEIFEPIDDDGDGVIDRYADRARAVVLNDHLPPSARTQVRTRNPVTGLFEGDLRGSAINPFGEPGFAAHGNAPALAMSEREQLRLRATYAVDDSIFGGATAGEIGLEMAGWTLRHFENSLPWSEAPFYDVYGYHSTLYADSTTPDIDAIYATPFRPLERAVYAQAALRHDALRVRAGVRIALFDANARVVPSRVRTSPARIVGEFESMPMAAARLHALPFLAIEYDVLDALTVDAAFASTARRPSFEALYTRAYISTHRGSAIVGNSDLDLERSTTIDYGMTARISESVALSARGYHRESWDGLAITLIPQVPGQFMQYVSMATTTARGFETELSIAVGRVARFDASYHHGSRATQDSATEMVDGEPLAASTDRTHAADVHLTLDWKRGEGPTIGGFDLLAGTRVFAAVGYRSGLPTYYDADKFTRDGERLPDRWISSAQFVREIPLDGILGGSFASSVLEVSISVENVLNWTGAIGSFLDRRGMQSGPDAAARIEFASTSITATPYFRDVVAGRPETYSANQYDLFGARRYNAYADANDDGVVTEEEKWQGYRRYAGAILSLREQYAFPRQVYVGIGLRF